MHWTSLAVDTVISGSGDLRINDVARYGTVDTREGLGTIPFSASPHQYSTEKDSVTRFILPPPPLFHSSLPVYSKSRDDRRLRKGWTKKRGHPEKREIPIYFLHRNL
ncbi:hypothetical protein TNCV_4131631 [Trichonephila clavipes]|nr:hypothetical protein TNCV_4131631 [Trichonephila clavipes]